MLTLLKNITYSILNAFRWTKISEKVPMCFKEVQVKFGDNCPAIPAYMVLDSKNYKYYWVGTAGITKGHKFPVNATHKWRITL